MFIFQEMFAWGCVSTLDACGQVETWVHGRGVESQPVDCPWAGEVEGSIHLG